MTFRLNLLAFVLLFTVVSCSDPNEEPSDDLKITFISDTAWAWEGGAKPMTIIVGSGSSDEVTLTYKDPYSIDRIEKKLKLDSNQISFSIPSMFLSETDMRRIEMTFSQSGRKSVVKTMYLGVGGTQLPIAIASAPGTVQRMNFYVFQIKTHPGASVTLTNPITDGTQTFGPVLFDGIAHFQGTVFSDVPLGNYTFRFKATRPNFTESVVLESVVRVTD